MKNTKKRNIIFILIMILGIGIMGSYALRTTIYKNKYDSKYLDPITITPRDKDEIIASGLIEEAITKDDFIRIICPGCIAEPGDPVVEISSVTPITVNDGDDREVDGVIYAGLSRTDFIREICPHCVADPNTNTIEVGISNGDTRTYSLVGIDTEYETHNNMIYVGNDYGKKNVILNSVALDGAEISVSETSSVVGGNTVVVTPKLRVKYNNKTYEYGISSGSRLTLRDKDEIIASGLVSEAISKDDFIRIICPECIAIPGDPIKPVVSIDSVTPIRVTGNDDRELDGVIYAGLSKDDFIREICPECIADPNTNTIEVGITSGATRTYSLLSVVTNYRARNNKIYVGSDYSNKTTVLNKINVDGAEKNIVEQRNTLSDGTEKTVKKLVVTYGDTSYEYELSPEEEPLVITPGNKDEIIASGIIEEAITKDDFIKIICPGCIAEPGDPILPVVSIDSVTPIILSDGDDERVIDGIIYVGLSRDEFIREICPECIADPNTNVIEVTTSDGNTRNYYMVGIVTNYKTGDNTIYVGADYGNKNVILSKITCEGATLDVITDGDNGDKLTVTYNGKTYEYELSPEEEPRVYGLADYIALAGYKIDASHGVIYNISDFTALLNFSDKFTFAKEIKVYDHDNVELDLQGSDYIATGYKLVITYEDDEVEEYMLSVRGDVLGIGHATKEGASKVAKHIIDKNVITGYEYLKAADFDDDGNIKMNDVINIIHSIGAGE